MSIFLQLAPMQAMTDIVFMNNYNRIFGGFNEMMAPYILATSKSLIKTARLKKIHSKLDENIVLIPQLLSNDAEGFIYYANKLYDEGFRKVNWNLGCPFPFVTKKNRGAGLLPYPDIIDSILDKITPKIKIDLSVKVRLGLNNEEEINQVIKVLNNYPIVETIIHPRTAIQKYNGSANIDFFSKIYSNLNMPVIYNGDIVKKEQVIDMQKQFPDLKGYMIGRGAFINPFITNQIAGIEYSDTDKINKYKDLYFSLHKYYKETTQDDIGFLHRMKDLWGYFSQSFDKGEDYIFTLRTINDVEKFESTVNNIFKTGTFKI